MCFGCPVWPARGAEARQATGGSSQVPAVRCAATTARLSRPVDDQRERGEPADYVLRNHSRSNPRGVSPSRNDAADDRKQVHRSAICGPPRSPQTATTIHVVARGARRGRVKKRHAENRPGHAQRSVVIPVLADLTVVGEALPQDSARPPPLSLRRAANRRSGLPEPCVMASRGARPPFGGCRRALGDDVVGNPPAPLVGIPGSRYHVWAEAGRTRGRRNRTIRPVNTATVLADAMTDYVLSVGVDRAAPAAWAPEHMAAWLEDPATTLCITRRSDASPVDCLRAWSRPPTDGRGQATVRGPGRVAGALGAAGRGPRRSARRWAKKWVSTSPPTAAALIQRLVPRGRFGSDS